MQQFISARDYTRTAFIIVLGLLVVSLIGSGFCAAFPPAASAHATAATATAQNKTNVNWPSFGFDALNSRFNPYEDSIGPGNVSHLTLDWSNRRIHGPFSPVVANGLLYLDTGAFIVAINASTGQTVWTVALGGITGEAPVVAHGILYVTDFDGSYGQLYALNASTGAQLWHFTSGGHNSYTKPVVFNGIVYTTWDNYVLYALNAKTGSLLWQFYADFAYCQPAIANGILYLGTFEHMDALNATTGTLIWQQNFGPTDGFHSVTIAHNTIYSVSFLNVLYAFDAATGTILWKAPTNISSFVTLAAAYGKLYGASQYGEVYAVNDTNGDLVWKANAGNQIDSAVAVANHVAYIGSYNQKMYAFDADDGKTLWIYATSFIFEQSSAIVVNGVLYFGSDQLYAFHITR